MTYSPDPSAARLVDTIAEESLALGTWTPVPPARLLTGPGGDVTATLPAGSGAFGRLRFLLRP